LLLVLVLLLHPLPFAQGLGVGSAGCMKTDTASEWTRRTRATAVMSRAATTMVAAIA
jgi:hypothetical protein